MVKLQTREAECDYKESNRELTQQFIHGLGDEGMMSWILREVPVLVDINNFTSEGALLWVQRVEAQRAQKEALDSIKEAKYFYPIR